MSRQLDLFDSVREETEAAIGLVESNTADEWREWALDRIHQLLLTSPTFHCDDFWEFDGGPPVHNERALGAIIRKASANGWMIRTSATRPSRRSHLSPKPVWESLIYEGGRLWSAGKPL